MSTDVPCGQRRQLRNSRLDTAAEVQLQCLHFYKQVRCRDTGTEELCNLTDSYQYYKLTLRFVSLSGGYFWTADTSDRDGGKLSLRAG